MDPSSQSHRVEWRTVALLTGLTAAALALRLYRLSDQSAWIDEFQLSSNMNAPDLTTYIELVRFRGKDNLPLYYTLVYYWYCIFGQTGTLILRVPAVISSVLSVPLLYFLTRAAFGRRAGEIAAGCLALSPTQIWYAQSIHLAAFWGMLALASAFTLHNAVSTRSRCYWFLVSAANLAMVWTQPFTLFFIWIECAYVLWRLWPRYVRAALWIALQGVICVSVMLFLYKTLFEAAEPEEDLAYQIPPVRTLLADLVADDAAMTVDPFAFQGQTWHFLPEKAQQDLVQAHLWVDWAMIAFCGACVLGSLFVVCRGLFFRDGWRRRFPTPDALHGAVLLLGIALIPLLLHILISLAWRPMLLQRFTSYSALAVYAAIGGGIASLRNKTLERSAIGVLFAFYGYQLSLALPATTRTDYQSAARHIAEHAQPGDVVLVTGTFISWEAFRFTAGTTPYEVLPAYSLRASCEKAVRLLGASTQEPEKPAPPKAVWVLIEPFVFTLPPLDRFERQLDALGLEAVRRDFPGMNGLFLYRLTRGQSMRDAREDVAFDLSPVTKYDLMLADLGFTPEDGGQYSRARRALEETWDFEFARTTLYYSLLSLQLASEGYLDIALRAADYAEKKNPQFAVASFAQAVILGEMARANDARDAFERAIAEDEIDNVQLYRPLFSALYWQKDPVAARVHLDEMDRLHAFMPFVCYLSTGAFDAAPSFRLDR